MIAVPTNSFEFDDELRNTLFWFRLVLLFFSFSLKYRLQNGKTCRWKRCLCLVCKHCGWTETYHRRERACILLKSVNKTFNSQTKASKCFTFVSCFKMDWLMYWIKTGSIRIEPLSAFQVILLLVNIFFSRERTVVVILHSVKFH